MNIFTKEWWTYLWNNVKSKETEVDMYEESIPKQKPKVDKLPVKHKTVWEQHQEFMAKHGNKLFTDPKYHKDQ